LLEFVQAGCNIYVRHSENELLQNQLTIHRM